MHQTSVFWEVEARSGCRGLERYSERREKSISARSERIRVACHDRQSEENHQCKSKQEALMTILCDVCWLGVGFFCEKLCSGCYVFHVSSIRRVILRRLFLVLARWQLDTRMITLHSSSGTARQRTTPNDTCSKETHGECRITHDALGTTTTTLPIKTQTSSL